MGGYTSTWEMRPDIGRHSIGNDITLMTRHFPTYYHWKSIIDGPEALIRTLGGSERAYGTEEAARDGHADLVRRINQWHAETAAA